jgi:hypothetical protein
MFLNQVFYTLSCLFLLNLSYAEIPFETLRTCIDLKPHNNSIKLTPLEDKGVATVNETNCEDQYNREFDAHVYGTVTCDNTLYLIVNNKKIKLNTAINKSINPEIRPGFPIFITSEWYKIDDDNKSYLCIQSALSESGPGSSLSQYYIVENAFDLKASPIVYYYFFNKDITPITSDHF